MALLAVTAVQSSCAAPSGNPECALFTKPQGRAEIAYTNTDELHGLTVSIWNTGPGPLCFFARDRLLASEIYVRKPSGEEVFVQYPDADRPWNDPLSNRIICIPPGSDSVRQDFAVRIGQDIKDLPKGEHHLSFRLIAFAPYMLVLAKADHSIGNGIPASDFSCGADRGSVQIEAETQIHIE